MRQRNNTHSALYVPADPPFVVLPGESVDYPVHLAGLFPVEDSALATGGVVNSAKPVVAGESGSELVPPKPGKRARRAPSGEEPTE